MGTEPAVQDAYAPHSVCFGCGPANAQGLRIKSHRADDDGLTASFRPASHHQAFTGVVNGGILGTLIDCHGNWTAAVALMDAGSGGPRGTPVLPSTVTARYEVVLRKPTPYGVVLELASRVAVLDVEAGRAEIEVEVRADDHVTALGTGLFVAVEEGHPAYHRWD